MATPNRTDGRPQPMAIGIDFGTSKCCVAAVRDGRAHVLENEFGQRTTPSWVAFNSQQRLVGGAALDQAVVNCANTVSAVKRTLGRSYDDVKHLSSPCKIIKNYDSFQYCVGYKKRDKCLRPEQITAMMLTKMKEIAETSLGCEVNRAVISVPASYGNAQRVALKTAAKVAGLEVLQLINETTAAGIAFADNRTATTPVKIAVVDFGAGKLDVSLMEVKEKSVKVITAAGNPNLGGCNIDEFLSDHCAALIREDCKTTLTANDKAMVRLRLACEKVKKTLSLLPEARLVIDSLIGNTNVDMPVHRKDLNVIKSEIQREINDIFYRLLRENNIRKDALDKVVLVGGSTRIPVVKSILEEYFGSHKLDQTVNQDEAVAQGAALRAAALSGAAAGIEVADVSSFDIFFRSHDQQIKRIYWRNSRIPFAMNILFSTWHKTRVEFYENSKSKESEKDALIGSLKFFGFPREIIIYVEMNIDGIFTFFVDQYVALSVQRRIFLHYPTHVVRDWTREESQFRRDIGDELKRVEAEVELESLIFGVKSALQDREVVKYYPRDIESRRSNCLIAQSCVDNISSVPEFKIEEQIKTMSETKTEVERMKVAAHKKAADEKAAKERAKLEQAVTQKNLELRLLHHELLKSLKQPELVQYSPPEKIRKCEEALGRIDTSQKLASLKEVSEKIELMNGVKSRIEKLKDSARKKALEEQETVRVEKQHLKEEISNGLSMVKSLLEELLSSKQEEGEDSELADNFQQKIKSFEKSLYGILGWVTNTDSNSPSEVLKKIEEVNEIREDVKLEVSLHSAQIRKTELKENTTEKSNNVSEMSSLENDSQIGQINNLDERVLHLESGDMQAQSTNSSAGHTPRSREKLRRNSPSRSRSTERKEKVDCDRSRSPLSKEIEMVHPTTSFGSSTDTERNQVSTVLSQGTRVELGHADGECRSWGETPVDSSKLSSSYGKEKEQPPASLGNTRVLLDHADGGCRPSQETTTETTKLHSSCGKEEKNHPPARIVSSETEGKNYAAVRNSSASASMHNGADYGSKTSGTSVPVAGPSLVASIPGIENCVDSNSGNATDSNTVVGLQRSSPEKVSSVCNDVIKNSTPAVVRSPSGAMEKESKTAPALLEREASESLNGANRLQENVAGTSNMFYQYPGLQEWIKGEINKCENCRSLGMVCNKTRGYVVQLLNEMIIDIGAQISRSAASGCNGEAPQQVTPKTKAAVPEVLEQVKKLSNRNTQCR